ncbi:MAG: pentapeptide repeat-containing protein [Acidobacteriota bacterium]
MATKDLVARWKSTPENDRASERIFNTCKYGGVLSIDQSPFGRVESDLIDFRGYPAHRILVKDVILKDLDLSYVDFSNCWLETNRFENCLFEKTDFSNASDHGNIFEYCVFVNCNFRMSAIGYDGSQFNNCIFNRCSFQRAIFTRAEFVNTEFLNCKLNGVDFNASSFENCKFVGLLDDVWFRGTFASQSQTDHFGQPKINKMKNVSFENADLKNLTFSNGCDLSTVTIKNNGRYFKYDNWYKRLQFLSKEIESWDDESQRNQAAKFLKISMVHAPTQDWEILSLDDWEKFLGGTEVTRKIVVFLNSC